MYRLFYNRKTTGDTLFIVIQPDVAPDEVVNKDDVIILRKQGELVGVNILHMSRIMKIFAEGMIVTPENVFVDVINHILINAGCPSLPYCEDSYYLVAKVKGKGKCDFDPSLNHLLLDLGGSEASAITRFDNMEEGDHLVVAKDGCIRFDGSLFRASKAHGVRSDVEVQSLKSLRLGEDESRAIIPNDLRVGMDFFLR